MEYLILIPLKKAYDIDLVKYLKVAITTQYSNVDEKTKESLETLNRMRNNVTNKTMDTRQEHSLETLEKYYDQISWLHSKLPQADVPFKWRDSFEKGGLFSSGSLTVSNIGYEKVSVLFNIGALMSNLGAYQGKEGASNDTSLKNAIKHFQGAAGIFLALKHTSCSTAGTNELTFDLQTDVLTLLQYIMLAQAQEAFFYKASNDKMKEMSIARIAAQCEEFYAEVHKQILNINTTNKTNIPEWVDVFVLKQHAYQGVAEYYQALVAQQKKEFGEQICRLTKAIEYLKAAEGKVAIPLTTKFKEIINKATQSLEEVKRDNDFIYHVKIPEHKTLPTINKAVLAKATDLPEMFFPGEQDLFQNLLPFGVHQSIQKLDQQRQEVVNGEIATLREQTQTLNAVLASLNLPAAIEDVKGVEVPKSLKEKAQSIQEKGGIDELERLINELPDLLTRNREILDEIERSLQQEEESDNKLKQQFGEKWKRTPSKQLSSTWTGHIAKYRNILQNAVQADNKVKEKYNSNVEKMKLLSNSSGSALADAIPTNQSSGAKVDETAIAKLKQLMAQVDALKKDRETLESSFKNVEFEEMKSKFMKSLSLHTDVNEASLSTETIGEYFGELQRKSRESQQKQESLVEEIRSANEQFVATRGGAGNKREQFLKELASAYDAFIELHSNLNEGTKFYNDLTQLLVNLQVKIDDFCFARKAEREELVKDLTNEPVTRPNDPVPTAPNYQKAEAPPRPPPPAAAPAPPSVPPTSAAAPHPHMAPGYPQPPMGQPQYYPAYPNQAYNYYPPPPLPSGFNPYVAPQGPMNPYYPPQYNPYQQGPGYYQQPPPQ
ncbi:Rhophilin, Rho GTPase binding protein [Tyrophagus putrescentiae]|nr:Rhophilin, Rho GTPase binding protein [Tyrophagus putrescentiae]